MIKDVLKTILLFIVAFIVGGLAMFIYTCIKIYEFLISLCILNQIKDPISILMIKKILIFLLYTFSGACLYLLNLYLNTDAYIMNSLLIMWTIMIIIEVVIPMVKGYIKR